MDASMPPSRQRDLFFLRRPQQWPRRPFPPLVRRQEGQEIEYGVIADLFGALDLPGYGATVFRTNLFLLPKTLEGLLVLPREVFDTVEERPLARPSTKGHAARRCH